MVVASTREDDVVDKKEDNIGDNFVRRISCLRLDPEDDEIDELLEIPRPTFHTIPLPL